MAKAVLTVNENFIVLQMAEKLFLAEAFKYHTYYRMADGVIVTWLRRLTSTFENRNNRSHFPG